MKRLTLFLALLFPSLAFGQAGGIITGGITVLSSSGRPVAGAQVAVCNVSDNGVPCTTTVNIFQDAALTIPAANPGTTDANGNFIAFASPGAYHITFTGNGINTTGQPFLVTVSTPSAGGGNVLLAGNNVMTGQNTFTNNNTFSGNNTLSGQNTIKAYSINNIVTVDGQKYTTATAALADPACSQASNAGCTIDMRGNSSPAALNLGTFDPGSSAPAIQLLLGPFVYHATQIVLRNGLHISGTNSGGGVGASPSTPSPPPTEIISNDTTTPMVVLGGTTAILGVNMEHFRLYCGAGNTAQIGLNIVAQHSFPASSGLWWSSFNDMFVGGDGVHECLGNPAVFDGNDAGSGNVNGAALNQFISFRDMRFFRGTNGGPVLISGLNGQFTFDGAIEFDGPTPRDNNHVNLVINDGTETFRAPYTFLFNNLTVQQAWGTSGRCMQVNGVKGLIISAGHFENCNGGVQLAIGNHYGNKGVVILASTFDTNTAIDSGSGYILSMDVNSQVDWIGNTIDGTPDTTYAGDITYLMHTNTLNAGNGLPYALPSAVSRFRVPVGLDSDSPAFKFGVVGFTGLTAGSRVNVNFPFTTPFPDNNYMPICSVDDFTTGGTSQGLVGEGIRGVPAPGSFNYTVFNPTGGPLNGNLYCWAVHP